MTELPQLEIIYRMMEAFAEGGEHLKVFQRLCNKV